VGRTRLQTWESNQKGALMFKPKVNSIGKSSRIVGENPEKPEFAQMKHATGNPGRKSSLSVKKPGRA